MSRAMSREALEMGQRVEEMFWFLEVRSYMERPGCDFGDSQQCFFHLLRIR